MQLRLLALALALVGSAALPSAGFGSPTTPAPPHDRPRWSYEGSHGPAAWGRLAPGFRTCSVGDHQSPIELDISHAEHASLPRIGVHYGATRLTEIATGHTLEDLVPAGEYVELSGMRYTLQQFHFHHPSEHTIDGVHAPLEIHLVHASSTGKRLVVSVLVRAGAEHAALRELFERAPATNHRIPLSLDPAALLPVDLHYATYEGSLTTPPCSEDVTWVVLRAPIEASAAQLEWFAERYPHNNRPVMPRNGRHVRVDP